MAEFGEKKRVTVVGAGFSGLAAAHHLHKAGFDVEVREGTERAGGLLGTVQTERGPVETAANGILNTPWVEELFEAAGVEMRTTSKSARARYIFREGRPRRFPLRAGEALRLGSFLFRLIFRKRSLAPRAGEALQAWGARTLSPSVSRYTLETAFQGIYAGDPARMSARLLLGRLFGTAPQTALPAPAAVPARPLKYKGTVAPAGGMGELIEGLRKSLEARGVRFQFGQPLEAEELRSATHPHVIATGVAPAAELLQIADPERAQFLKAVEVLPLVTTTVHFLEGSMPYAGFGCLFPPGEAGVLGVLFNNHIYDWRIKGCLAETWIMGGALFGSNRLVTDLDDQEIINRIRKERVRLAGQDVEPLSYRITRWPKALPHFTVEMEEALLQFKTNRSNLYLLGNYTGGIGLARILDQAAALPQEIARSGSWTDKSK